MRKTIIFDRDLDCVVVLDVPGDGKGTKGRKERDAALAAYSREMNHIIMFEPVLSQEWYRMNERERAFVQLSLVKRREILTKWHAPESTWVSIAEETGLDGDLVSAVVAANAAPNGMVRSEPRDFTIWGAGLGGETGEEAESG